MKPTIEEEIKPKNYRYASMIACGMELDQPLFHIMMVDGKCDDPDCAHEAYVMHGKPRLKLSMLYILEEMQKS